MKLKNAKEAVSVYESVADLPKWQELNKLDSGNFVRLRTVAGSYFWAKILFKHGQRLVCIADDNISEIKRLTTVECGTGDIFDYV